MRDEQIRQLFDDAYAAVYDELFLLHDWPRAGVDFDANVVRDLVSGDRTRWLDVACGTGLFLSRFPGVARAGLDLSPAMVAKARSANSDALFIREGDMRMDVEEWRGAWTVVTCLWWAYAYVQSIWEVEQLVRNMIRWTAPGGAVYIPVGDLEDVRYVDVAYKEQPEVWGGTLTLTGATWTWEDPNTGRRHEHLVAPHVGHFVHLLRGDFSRIDVLRYPPFFPGGIARKAVLATGRLAPGAQCAPAIVWHEPPPNAGPPRIEPAASAPTGIVDIPTLALARELARRARRRHGGPWRSLLLELKRGLSRAGRRP